MKRLVTAGRHYKAELATDVFAAARARMRYLYETFDQVVVSWSGGKDSTSCLELALEAATELGKLPVQVFFLDEEVIYPETLELIDRHRRDPRISFFWYCVPSIYRNACSEVEPDFIPFDPAKRALWTHVPPKEAVWPCGHDDRGLPLMSAWRIPPSITAHCMEHGWGPAWKAGQRVACIVGLRAQESFVRFSGLMSSGDFITKKPYHGYYVARPIYDWRAGDVWLAIKENGWDYNRAYDKLWRAGGNPINTRVAPLFHAEAAMHLRDVMLFWPAFWLKVRYRVRGAHSVAIYNGALHKVERYKGETWQDAATRYLNGLGSEVDRAQLHAYVTRSIKSHEQHSQAPVPDSHRHRCQECGISWQLIARAVARGDRQERILRVNQSMPISKHVKEAVLNDPVA